MIRFTLPRDLYHGPGALEALKTFAGKRAMVCVGGGAMMLLVLTLVLGFELKTAIGTSVFIMSFTALFGAVSHFALGAKPNLWVMFLCIATTLIAAEISAVFANNAPLKKLNKAVGVCLLIFAVVLILLNVFGKTA